MFWIDYSSILLHVGTNSGNLATFKLLPDAAGRYNVQFVGNVKLADWVVRIAPIRADSGNSACATQSAVNGLRDGFKTNGVLLTVTHSEARLFKPASSKGAHKAWDNYLCDSAAMVKYQNIGWVLLGLFGDGCAKAFSVPGLKEIGSMKIDEGLDVRNFGKAHITATGSVLGWTGPSQMALVSAIGSGWSV